MATRNQIAIEAKLKYSLLLICIISYFLKLNTNCLGKCMILQIRIRLPVMKNYLKTEKARTF